MLSDLNMGVNAISELAKGKQMSCIALAWIAGYLDCSVDYLLGRTDNPDINRWKEPAATFCFFRRLPFFFFAKEKSGGLISPGIP